MAKQAVVEAQKEARLAAIEDKLDKVLALLEARDQAPAVVETQKAKPSKDAAKPAEKQ